MIDEQLLMLVYAIQDEAMLIRKTSKRNGGLPTEKWILVDRQYPTRQNPTPSATVSHPIIAIKKFPLDFLR